MTVRKIITQWSDGYNSQLVGSEQALDLNDLNDWVMNAVKELHVTEEGSY